MISHYEYTKRESIPHQAMARKLVREHGVEALYYREGKDTFGKMTAVTTALFDAYVPNVETISQVFGTPDSLRLYRYYCRTLSRPDANAMFMEQYMMRQHANHGKKVYEISPGLAEQLKFTEFRNVTCDAVRLPYRNIYIQVPKAAGLEFKPLKFGEAGLDLVSVNGIYISEAEPELDIDINPLGSVTLDSSGVLSKGSITRMWRILCISAPYESKAANGTKVYDDSTTLSFDILLPDGQPIEEAIRLKVAQREQLPEDLQKIFDETNRGMAPTWENIFRWLFNVVAYATSPNTEIGGGWENKEARDLRDRIRKTAFGHKRQDLRARLHALDPQYRIYLGQKVFRLDVQKRLKDLNEEGRKLLWRLLVSGHWKHQPYGIGRLERKLIWVSPYWKGSENAEQINPRHALSETRPR